MPKPRPFEEREGITRKRRIDPRLDDLMIGEGKTRGQAAILAQAFRGELVPTETGVS